MAMKKYSKGMGWFGESHPHSLCAKGVKLGRHKDTLSRINYAGLTSNIKTVKTTKYLGDGFEFSLEPINDTVSITNTPDGGYEVKYLVQDVNPESPREWDNFGHMVAFHDRYNLGDKTDLKSDQFNGWDELQNYLVKEKEAVVIMPIYLYDHSGLRMKVGSFQGLLPQGHAEFDSGQVGFIYATKEDLKREGFTKKQVEKYLQGEIETYDQYLSNDVYGTVIEKYDKNKKLIDTESVWGNYGYNNAKEALKEMDFTSYPKSSSKGQKRLTDFAKKTSDLEPINKGFRELAIKKKLTGRQKIEGLMFGMYKSKLPKSEKSDLLKDIFSTDILKKEKVRPKYIKMFEKMK
jgi:hypothetical protein